MELLGDVWQMCSHIMHWFKCGNLAAGKMAEYEIAPPLGMVAELAFSTGVEGPYLLGSLVAFTLPTECGSLENLNSWVP